MNVLAPGSGFVRNQGPAHGRLAPAFTFFGAVASLKIGILGVRPRLQQRDCPRFARGSSRRPQVNHHVEALRADGKAISTKGSRFFGDAKTVGAGME